MSEIKRVGFIGLGNMGHPMAGHFAATGFDLVVYDVSQEMLERFMAVHEATAARSLAELGRDCDVVITMLPTSKIVRNVLLGDGSGGCVADGLEAGNTVIDMSTSDPNDTKATGKELEAKGIRMVDVPVSGGVVFAKDASLSMNMGGEQDVLEHCKPIFDTVGKDTFYCGPLGAGHAMKVLNNYIVGTHLITVYEALAMGRRFGLEFDVLLPSMTAATSGRNDALLKKATPYVEKPDHATGMFLALLSKDMRLADEMAEGIGAFAPIAKQAAALWTEASEKYGGDLDQLEVARLWEDGSEVVLKNPKD